MANEVSMNKVTVELLLMYCLCCAILITYTCLIMSVRCPVVIVQVMFLGYLSINNILLLIVY